jgi:hypothetical protein
MKNNVLRFLTLFTLLVTGSLLVFAQETKSFASKRIIEFPDIPGYRTLKCDFHMHTVFSDGSVWPDIRVQEALQDGLDAISITDHIEYQNKAKDIPHPDRNRGYEIARAAARGSGLIVINGAEITRSMPPGHANAIFLKDVNRLNQEDVMEVFREARRQDAFVFWNHPHWTDQQPNGIVPLAPMHLDLFSEGLISGIEIYNEYTYSDEALQIALDHGLTLMGNSDIHGLIDYQFSVPEGGHRPVTLVFATEKSEQAIREALDRGRTAVWFDNTLVGDPAYLAPLVTSSVKAMKKGSGPVQEVVFENSSDADYIFENRSEYTLHNKASVFIVKAHDRTSIFVKTVEELDAFTLRFGVLNTFTSPGSHTEIEFRLE